MPDHVSAVATTYQFIPAALLEGAARDHAIDAYPLHPIVVQWRGGDTWAVCRGEASPRMVWCEDVAEWEYEPIPSERDEAFLARCRYGLAQALIIGARLANGVDR